MKFWVIAFFMLCVPAMAFADSGAAKPALEPFYFQTAKGARHDLMIEIARTEPERQKGLMFRSEMDKNSGMLFLFGTEEMRSFWMKNTLIPLDLVFMNKNGVITHIHEMAKPHDETLLSSVTPAFAVLEINGGRAAELGLKQGDSAHHAVFGNMLADDKAIQ